VSVERILVLEDDVNLGTLLCDHLEMHGFQVRLCPNGEEGSAVYQQDGPWDLCLVDVMMPRKDGFTFAREVREGNATTPIIFLTARSLKEDRIEGFRVGGDDYVTKPFSVEELLLRIRAVLRRRMPSGTPDPEVFALGRFTFDPGKRLLRIGDADRRLTTKESALMRLLCEHANRTLERDRALREIWGDDSYFNARSMDVFISRLRKYLREDGTVEILTVHGRGFSLVTNR
jgi:DNA-binding response OmpR family regulator